MEEDPGKSCRNYPIPGFSSYAECDDEYMRARIKEAAPGMNLTPVWLTSNWFMCPICNTCVEYEFDIDVHIRFCVADKIDTHIKIGNQIEFV